MIKIYLACMFWISAQAQAEPTVYIQSSGVSHRFYLRQVREAGAKTYSEWWLRERATRLEPQMLEGDFNRAEQAFLSAEMRPARELYFNIVQRRHRFDWPKASRERIFNALLRMAMIESESEGRRRWLVEALHFDPQIDPDADIFPPPLLEELAILRNSLPSQKLRTDSWPTSIHTALINGREIPRTPEISLPSQNFRLTLLSDQNFPMTQMMDLEKGDDSTWTVEPLVQGHCLQPEWTRTKDHYPRHHRVIFEESCETPSAVPPITAKIPSPLPLAQSIIASSPEKAPSFWRNKWFWLGVGAVVGGTVLYQQIRAQNSSPTTRDGF